MHATLTRRPPPWSPWRPRPDAAPRAVAARPRPAAVAAIKAVHTLAWLSIESCVLYVLYAGFAGRTEKGVGIAGAIVASETLVFAGNGFRCPLTELAERYGAQSGSVADIYLPRWFAHNMPAVHTPLLVLMTYLHARNLAVPADSQERVAPPPPAPRIAAPGAHSADEGVRRCDRRGADDRRRPGQLTLALLGSPA